MTTEFHCFDKTCKSRNKNDGLTLVLVKWNDASYQSGPIYFGDIRPNVIMITGGLLVQETDSHYSIAMDFYEEEGTWRHITNIPKGMVLEVQRLPMSHKDLETIPTLAEF